mgnify:CR=1 FL=1
MNDSPTGPVPTGPVLVGTDGSAVATRALGVAAGLARALDAELIVVYAVGLTAVIDGELVPAAEHRDDLERLLRSDWTASLGAPGERVRWRAALEYGSAADVLTRLADELETSFVVVGTRGHRDLGPGLLGSTSHHVVHHCRRPVVVVPPDTGD